MKATRILLALALLLVAAPALVMAAPGGAGGVGFGVQYVDLGLANRDLALSYITGYGYGVSWNGARIGGFGTALLGSASRTWGGVGGLLTGYELRAGPVEVALNLMGGPGGIGMAGQGFFILFGQADLEVGVAVLPWMQVVFYGGYQAWGNMVPGRPLASSLTTPVLGVRLAWGAF